jgi:phosphatidylserine decarboxylase
MRFPFTKHGWRELLLATVFCAALGAVAASSFWPAAALPALLWVYCLAFFRDPVRVAPATDSLLAVADGRVTDITPADPDILGEPATRVGVFMGLLSVHINRSPQAGRVLSITHKPGGYADARRNDAWATNESASVDMQVGSGRQAYRLQVRQIAGFVARRIVTDLAVGQELRAGQVIGMIKFGSRAELIVPDRVIGRLAVSVGQYVYAGQTVLVEPKRPEKP